MVNSELEAEMAQLVPTVEICGGGNRVIGELGNWGNGELGKWGRHDTRWCHRAICYVRYDTYVLMW